MIQGDSRLERLRRVCQPPLWICVLITWVWLFFFFSLVCSHVTVTSMTTSALSVHATAQTLMHFRTGGSFEDLPLDAIPLMHVAPMVLQRAKTRVYHIDWLSLALI